MSVSPIRICWEMALTGSHSAATLWHRAGLRIDSSSFADSRGRLFGGRPGHVAAGMRQIADQSCADRVGRARATMIGIVELACFAATAAAEAIATMTSGRFFRYLSRKDRETREIAIAERRSTTIVLPST